MSFLQCTRCAILIAKSEAKREMQECAKAWESESEAWESESVRERSESVGKRERARESEV